jgi:hypothetical protein
VTSDVQVLQSTDPPDHLDEIVMAAARSVGLPTDQLRLIRHFANAVYLIEDGDGPAVVARVAYGSGVRERARRSVDVVRWLVDQGFPATDVVDVAQPVSPDGPGKQVAVTFWHYYCQPEGEPPGVDRLGGIARRLHGIGDRPPVPLHSYEPLESMRRLVSHDIAGDVLRADSLAWLRDRIDQLCAQFADLDFPLGVGLIHGDMYIGNLLWSGSDAVLGDWDSVCLGPREVDLAPTFTAARFGLSEEARDGFARAYGYDLRIWPGWPTLREIREISTLSAPIRLAAHKPALAQELQYRVGTLRDGDRNARWTVQ